MAECSIWEGKVIFLCEKTRSQGVAVGDLVDVRASFQHPNRYLSWNDRAGKNSR